MQLSGHSRSQAVVIGRSVLAIVLLLGLLQAGVVAALQFSAWRAYQLAESLVRLNQDAYGVRNFANLQAKESGLLMEALLAKRPG